MKISCLTILLGFLVNLTLLAQPFIRYNHAGYNPERPKIIVIMSETNLEGSNWKVKLEGDSVLGGVLQKHRTSAGDHTPFLYNYSVDLSQLTRVGAYEFILGPQIITIKISPKPYAKYTSALLRYLRQQRSGTSTTLDHKASHLQDSSAQLFNQGTPDMLWTAKDRKVNVVGGWYDAGDYLKFTLTNAYTVYNLLRAHETNPLIFQQKQYANGIYNDLLDEVKFGLDYLERCFVDDTTFVIQVGNEQDHQQGNRLPHLDQNAGNRGAYAALSKPHLAYCAADFALASQLFSVDSTLSEHYLRLGKKLFAMAKESTITTWYEKDHEVFYSDKNPLDNLLLAAAELYRASDEAQYLEDIKYFVHEAKQGYWAAWGDYHLQAQLRAYPFETKAMRYVAQDMMTFQANANHTNNVFGVPHEYTWATLYSMIIVANGGAYADLLRKNDTYSTLSYDVLDYVFGRNNWGVSLLAHPDLQPSVMNIYSQVYQLQPNLFPLGALAEGPGDKKTHDELMQWFSISRENYERFAPFNTEEVVFFDDNSDFQCMETTIGGLSDMILLIALLEQ